MALCSQAFLPSCKRTCGYTQLVQHESPAAKRMCLSKINMNTVSNKRLPQVCFKQVAGGTCYSSSSDSLSDSEDQQSCYIADQIRAKRRASSRVSFSLDDKLSKAVAQYSDDDEGHYEPSKPTSSRSSDDDNLDCKLLSSPCKSSVYVNNLHGNIQMLHRTSSSGNFFHISDSCSSVNSSKNSMPVSDKSARARCFDYLVGAIDEAWARYCDAASHIENEAYGYNAPGSSVTDDEDDCGVTTDLTDYDTDFEHKQVFKPIMLRKPSIMGPSVQINATEQTSTSRDPSSCHLQALKDRLTKAKYFLQDLVDSEDYNDAYAYWKRWDMIKYATIELVEDDDDDDVVENTIEELENGRLFAN
ncbi:hypothetical protein METBIDRAFT_13936 [Metschnikowia bicuspidata var. bicuspidata NRRL YB-4993]|uniref:Uncharacterized protein n=1 Tax=Metschnikowia bicuspidata var. bicuspidata NRRL YB-4993 TaxID=869754 RepID=A0A1A0H246_9ASCO|nr:hypothetical protein METBIDRAFT_13936 [Metschnikowia bicuspidata var. bicuspidata NRRL YB-4993]OBA18028.1 hypothetical protein METBIDRAFT_13936 [Metschnikowia bicuspidata var. bicuspidata NRRL YB-4993]